MRWFQGRRAGFLYLLVGIFGGFSLGWFQPQLLVAGDPGATARALAGLAPWAPWGIAADLVQAVAFVFLALELYRVFSPQAAGASRTFLVLVAAAAALMVGGNALVWAAFDLRAFPDQAYLVALIQWKGALMAQVFFGLWLVPWGWAGWKTGILPRTLSVLLMAGGVGYLVQLAILLGAPAWGPTWGAAVVVPSAAAEISAVVWLLVRGLPEVPLKAPKD